MHADQPINASAEDRFGRSNFAKRAALVIADRVDPSSLVVGIYAPWGEGKTSTLNMIVEELQSHERVLIVTFNPWRFPDEHQLLQKFFSTLARKFDASLRTKGEKLSEIADKYAAVLSPIPVAGRGLEGFVKGFARDRKDADLETLRGRIEAILAKSNSRIVVLMDDIDRLENEEIHAIFRLVKLSADFPNTTYLLAFDEKRVAEALETKYGSFEAGRNFLEKIVQVPLPLPPARVKALRALALEGISSALDLAKMELSDHQRQRFSDVFDKAFLRRISTPRAARRFANALTFILPITKNEVDPVDMILLEAVRVFYPNVYNSIRQNSDLYSGSVQMSLSKTDDEIKRQTSDAIEIATKDLSDEDSKAARVAIQALFPRTGANGSFTAVPEHKASRGKRISSVEYLPRYFNYGVPPDDVSDVEVEEFLRELDSSFVSIFAVDPKFEAMLANDRANVVISKLRLFEDELSADAAQSLAKLLARNGDKLPPSHPTDRFFGVGAYAQTSMLLRHLVQSLPEESRETLCLKLAEEIKPLPLALEYTKWMRPIKRDEYSEEMVPVVSTQCESETRVTVARRIAKFAETTAIESVYPLDAQELYQFWFATDAESLRNQLNTRMLSHPKEAARFVAALVGIGPATESEMSVSFTFPQEREWYELIGKMIDPEVLASALKQTPISPSQERKKPKALTGEERAAKWFLKMKENSANRTEDETSERNGADNSPAMKAS